VVSEEKLFLKSDQNGMSNSTEIWWEAPMEGYVLIFLKAE
jgi:hypothetical protein